MRLFSTLAAVAALAVSSAAIAADLPSTAAPAPISPAFTAAPITKSASSVNWSGFYAGVNGGFSVDDSDILGKGNTSTSFYQSLEKAGLGRHNDSAKFTGGGQIGYAYQIGDVVVGAEADINYLNSDRKYVDRDLDVRAKTQYFGTVRPTLGYLLTDNLLAYGTAGLAYGHTKTHVLVDPFRVNGSDTRYGYAVGGGAKYAVTNDIFVKGEYLYTNLGSKTYALTDAAYNVGGYAKDETAFHTFRVGVDYKFY